MSLTGTSSLSIKKSDLTSDRSMGVYRKIQFATKATGGETGINLASLTTPSAEMPGFVQATSAEIAAAQILFNQKNLTLTSSVRGTLVQYMSYVVASSSQINFTDSFGTALPGEIFVGVIDGTDRQGTAPAATSQIVATGTLSANTTDFVVGTPFTTNQYPSMQAGAVLVYLDGQLMMRNTGNATAAPSADGNYQEVPTAGGFSSTIRFNIADLSNDRVVTVVSNGALSEQPSGSMKATIETLAGQQDAVIQTVAQLAGVPTTNFYTAPNNVDMLTFGNSVLTLQQNAALKNVSNTWTQPQLMLGQTNGVAIPAGYVGETLEANGGTLGTITIGTSNANTSICGVTLTPGIWEVSGTFYVVAGATTAWSEAAWWVGPTNNGIDTIAKGGFGQTNGFQTLCPVNKAFIASAGSRRFNVTSNTPVYLSASVTYSVLGGAAYSSSSYIKAIRIA